MTGMKGRYGWMAVVLLGLVAVLALAWRDGGAEPMRLIAEPVPLPEGAR